LNWKRGFGCNHSLKRSSLLIFYQPTITCIGFCSNSFFF